MALAISIQLTNFFRLFVISEIAFVVGFLCLRVWRRRYNPDHYLFQMAIGLVLFASYVAASLAIRYGESMTWRTPYAFIAATITLVAVLNEGRKR